MSRRIAALVCGALTLPVLATTAAPAASAQSLSVRISSASPARAATTVPARTTSSAAAKKKAAAKKAAAKKAAAQKAAAQKAATPARVFVSRSTAQPRPVKDSRGVVWGPRTVGYGTHNRSDGLAAKADILGTANDDLFRSNAWDIKYHWTEVPAPATYRVRLLMAEDFWSEPGKRVFDVTAEGRTVVRDVDIAKAVGKGRAYEVSFPVTVTDGRLDLTFDAKADKPLISAVEVVSTTPVRPATTSATTLGVPLWSGSYAKQSIRNAPLAPNSSETVKLLAKNVSDHWQGVAAFNAYQYNSTVYTVAPDQKKITVAFNDCQKKGYTPANLFSGRKQFVDVPVPDDAVAAVGTDAEMTIYDPAADKVWEFWQMRRNAAGAWSACWGGRIDDVSTSQPIFAAPYGATASGLLLGGTMVTADEIKKGRIDHAIPIAVIDVGRWDRFSWPANRSDGASTDPDAVLEGQRLRLDPTLDVSTLDLTPVGQIIARAAQEYGFVVVDKGGAVAIIAESGQPEKNRTGSNPWDLLLGGNATKVMRNFPWERMQAVRIDHGRP